MPRTHAVASFADGDRHSSAHALSSQIGQFLCERMSFRILDVQSHGNQSTTYWSRSTITYRRH